MASTPAMPTPTPIPTDAPVERLKECVLVGEAELVAIEANNEELTVDGLDVVVGDELIELENADIVLEFVISWAEVSCQRLRSCNPLFDDEPILRRIDYRTAT